MSAFNKLPSFAGTTWVTAFKSRLIIDSDDSHQLKINLNGTVQTIATLGQTQTLTNKRFPDGTAAAPSITFANDTDSGFYRIGANNIGLALNGAIELNITTAAFSPGASGGSALGTTALMWSNLFLASAGVINFNNGDVTITHAANALTVAGGTFNVASSGAAYVFTEGTPAVAIYTSNASTSGSTSAESFLVSNTQTGAGGVGGRARFYMTTNVALAGWSNALKAEVTYGASGQTTGLGSAFVAEMTLSAGTTQGNYAPLEVELNVPSSASLGTKTALGYFSVQGADVATFDTSGYLFTIAGLTVGSGKLFQANTAAAATHALRVNIGNTDYFVMLTSAGA